MIGKCLAMFFFFFKAIKPYYKLTVTFKQAA